MNQESYKDAKFFITKLEMVMCLHTSNFEAYSEESEKYGLVVLFTNGERMVIDYETREERNIAFQNLYSVLINS